MAREETTDQVPYVSSAEALRAGADALYEAAQTYEDQADRGFYGGRDYSEMCSHASRQYAAKLRMQADRLIFLLRSV